MALEFREVTEENYQEFIELEVKPDQKDCFFFKSTKPNMMTLAQAYIYPERKVLAVFDDDVLLGSVFFNPDTAPPDKSRKAWLTRLMIDQRYQGKGFGKRTMELLIATIKQHHNGRQVKLGLSYEPHNKLAEKMYTDLGFNHEGDISGGQIVVWLDIE